MKKKKIWSTITRLTFAFMFVASWAVLGVALALKTAKIEINGGITFTATDVYAKISGSVTGTKTTNPIDEHPIEIDASTSSDFTLDSSWTNMNLDFQNASTPIVVTITIENKSSERPFWIVFADNIEEYHEAYSHGRKEEIAITYHNTDVIRKVDETTPPLLNPFDSYSCSKRYTPIKLDGGKSTTIETTINIHNSNFSANDNFKLGIELIGENVIKDESEYTKLTFTTSDIHDEYKTASVKASSIDIEGEVVIPALFSKNGEIYIVTEIEGYEVCRYLNLDDVPSTDNIGFANCTNMTSITIPATIQLIRAFAFARCFSCLCIADTISWQEKDGYMIIYDYTTPQQLLLGSNATSITTADYCGIIRNFL